MKRIAILIALAAMLTGVKYRCLAQESSAPLVTINNQPIHPNEFLALYLKNHGNSQAPIDGKTIDNYLDLFINFKLKVIAAKEQQLDTSAAFQREYQGYINQLAQSYLIDSAILNRLVNEAYRRMQTEISASHILISVPQNLPASDTLRYYNKALKIRNRINRGEPFGKVALETSNDPSVSHNNGYLGWFSVFQMLYPFETAAYSTPVDSLSMPVRTRFGYHIIKVHGKRPARGKLKVAHILIRVKPNASQEEVDAARQKINALYSRLLNGDSFADLAKKESQDPGSASQGGELPWIKPGQTLPEFERVAYSLSKNGDISKPFQSSYGWHIIKRIDSKKIGTLAEMLPEIEQHIARDSRSAILKTTLINRIKQNGNFTAADSIIRSLLPYLDSTLYPGKWKAPKLSNNPVVFTISSTPYNLMQLARYIEANQRMAKRMPLPKFLEQSANRWIENILINTEITRLKTENPEFKQLAREYYEGMLLFEISNRTIWQQNIDSTELAEFFNNHKENYRWKERVHYAVFTLADPKLSDKFKRFLIKKRKKGLSPEAITRLFNKKYGNESVKYEKTTVNSPQTDIDNSKPTGEYSEWPNHIKPDSDRTRITLFIGKTYNDPKVLDECRAEVISDYQKQLEAKWVAGLKKRYPIVVNHAVLQKIKDTFAGNQ